MIQNHQQYQAVLIRELYLYCLQLAFVKELSLFFSLVEKGLLAETEDSAETHIGSLLGQEYAPESSLYYYNARYYDPSIGVFTTADTMIPSSTDPMAYNRYMYVRGNPIIYTDPTGHFFKWFWNKVVKPVAKFIGNVASTVVATAATIVTAPIIAAHSAITGQNLWDTTKNYFNGFKTATNAALLAPIAINPLLTGIISAAEGGNFWDGLAAGFGNLLLAGATLGGSFALSFGNAFAAGYNGIYSRDEQGEQAFLLDHTVGQGTTAVGTVNIAIQAIGGAKFDKDLSKGSNAFIFRGGSIRSNSIGNVVSIHKEDAGNLEVLREELLHNWQYRRGGLLSLTRLGIIERIAEATGSNPYRERKGSFGYKYLEYQARKGSLLPYHERPWELRCRTCDKFY